MRQERINASFQTIGAFWELHDREAWFTGTLTADDGRVKLLRAPASTGLSITDALRASVEMFNTSLWSNEVEVFHGITDKGACTLIGAHCFDSGGFINVDEGVSINSPTFHIATSIVGMHVGSADDPLITGGHYFFSKVNRWLPHPWVIDLGGDERSISSPARITKLFQFSSLFLQAEISCQSTSGVKVRNGRSAKLRASVHIDIKPRTAKSIEWFHSLSARLENFFTLCLGTSVSIKAVRLSQGNSEGWVVQKRQRKKERIDVQAWIRTNPQVVAAALAAWLAVPEESLAVEKTVLGTVRKSSLFVETEFLALAQALEAFSRLEGDDRILEEQAFKVGSERVMHEVDVIFGKSPIADRCNNALKHANEISFANRVLKLYDNLGSAFAEQLLGNRKKFVRTITDTRNYFTHLGIAKSGSVVDDGKGLFLLNQQLKAFLRALMLISLNVPEAELTSPILYQAKKWK